jgi:hypothetical protein
MSELDSRNHGTWLLSVFLYNADAWIIPAVGEQVADFLMNVSRCPTDWRNYRRRSSRCRRPANGQEPSAARSRTTSQSGGLDVVQRDSSDPQCSRTGH